MIVIEGVFEAGEFDYEGLLAELKKDMRALAKSMQSDFNLATREWDHKPEFPVRGPAIVGGDLVTTVVPAGPNAQIFEWVDLGTEEHDIVPRGDYPMTFRTGYAAKSVSGTLWPTGGIGKFGPYRSTYFVKHPGIEPREFSRRISLNHLDWFQDRVARTMLKFARRSNKA